MGAPIHDFPTFRPALHALCGYTEEDVKNLLAQVRCHLTNDPRLHLFEENKIFPLLKDAYDGYLFANRDKEQARVYNADSVPKKNENQHRCQQGVKMVSKTYFNTVLTPL